MSTPPGDDPESGLRARAVRAFHDWLEEALPTFDEVTRRRLEGYRARSLAAELQAEKVGASVDLAICAGVDLVALVAVASGESVDVPALLAALGAHKESCVN